MTRLAEKVCEELEATLSTMSGGQNEIRICCLFCGESKYKLYINPEKGKFQCFKCGMSSGMTDFITLYAKANDIDYIAALGKLQMYVEDDAKATVEESLDWLVDKEFVEDKAPPNVLGSLPDGCIPYSQEPNNYVFKYLIDRGFTPDELVAYGVHGVGSWNVFIPYKGKKVNLKERVIFPIYDPWTRDLVSYLARATFECGTFIPKYINAPNVELSTIVAPASFKYGEDIVVCEGYIDAIAIRRTGVQAYCTFGKKLSDKQVEVLLSFKPNSVTVFFDQGAEKEADLAARRLAKSLGNRKVFIANPNKLPDGKDTGDTLTMHDGRDIVQSCLDSKLGLDSDDYAFYLLGLKLEP